MQSDAAPVPEVNASATPEDRSQAPTEPDRRIEALVRDFFTTEEQYDFACDDLKYRIDSPPEGDIHHRVEDACLAQEPNTINECEALLRVVRHIIERYWGRKDWHGAVLHLLDSLGRDLARFDGNSLERVKLDAAGPDPSASVKIAVARDILGRLGVGEPLLNSACALLGRMEAVVAEAEDRARECKAIA